MERFEFQIFSMEDPHILIAERQSVEMSYYIREGAYVAEDIGKLYFWGPKWQESFGADNSACVCLEIIEPPEVVGFYEMSMERVIEASARPCSDPRLRE
jgi:hypothetical protein